MAFTLSFDAGDDAQINGKCHKKISTLTTGTANVAGADRVFTNCTSCVGIQTDPPPNNSTVSTTACGTPFYQTETYNGLQNWKRINGARVDGVVPDLLVRITVGPGFVPAGETRIVEWCGKTWKLPADNGVTKRVCPHAARLNHQPNGTWTTTNPLGGAGGTYPAYGDDPIGRNKLSFGDTVVLFEPGINFERRRKTATFFTTAETVMNVDLGVGSIELKGGVFRARNVAEFQGFGNRAKSYASNGKAQVLVETDNSYRGFGVGPAARREHRGNAGTALRDLQRGHTNMLIPESLSGAYMTNFNTAAKIPASWLTHATRAKGQNILFEWFEGNNWAAWNGGF
jgi:hypothetical protein